MRKILVYSTLYTIILLLFTNFFKKINIKKQTDKQYKYYGKKSDKNCVDNVVRTNAFGVFGRIDLAK